MPHTRAMLDSPAVQLPSAKKKPAAVAPASASSSSKAKSKAKECLERLPTLQALPTPPATRKRKRARSRVTDSDTEEDEHELPVLDSDKEEAKESKRPAEKTKADAIVIGHKKRRTLKLDTIAEELAQQAEEDAFWMGDSSASILPIVPKSVKALEKVEEGTDTEEEERGRSRTHSRSPTHSPSPSPPPHLLRRNRTGLFSPPPSRRYPKRAARLATPPLPRTPSPKRKSRKADAASKKVLPERDSPNNPFLDDEPPVAGSSSLSPVPRTPEPYVEKPTITMVYRGVKHEFVNPLYDPDAPNGVPSLRNSPSALDPTDPDYSPTPYCPPKLLFPEARKHNHARLRARASSSPATRKNIASPKNADDSEPQEEALFSTPKPKGKGKAVEKPQTRATVRTKAKAPAKKSEWDSSDDEAEAPHVEPQLRRSPRLAGRYKAAEASAAPSPRVQKVDKRAGKAERGADVKKAAKLAPLLFSGGD